MNIVTISNGDPSKCELCGVTAILRPYGPNGEKICFQCLKKNEPAARQRFIDVVNGADVIAWKIDPPKTTTKCEKGTLLE